MSWSTEELGILRNRYGEEGSKCLPHRDKSHLHEKAARMGLKFERVKRWKEEEIQTLKKYYKYVGSSCIPYRSQKCVTTKASLLGLKTVTKYRTKHDREMISKGHIDLICIRNIAAMKRDKLLKNLSKDLGVNYRTLKESGHADMVGKRWTQEEDEQLRLLYPKLGSAAIPNRSKKSVKYRAAKLRIKYERV